ncbi:MULTISPECIES: hypothetical protein [Paracoccus]|uniref:hypothetical protein n=1 Tax=Paracoccus TaxID=265 RepID=UPI00110F962B|nr:MULTISPECIES: hypothetical protein [Paracoccus]
MSEIVRESMEYDVVIVGGGLAALEHPFDPAPDARRVVGADAVEVRQVHIRAFVRCVDIDGGGVPGRDDPSANPKARETLVQKDRAAKPQGRSRLQNRWAGRGHAK